MAGFAKFALQSIMVEPVLQYFADRNVRREYPRTVIVSGDYVGRWIQIAGCYEEHVLNVVSEFLRERLDCKALTCIDIGANIGNHTAWFARMFGKVLAIEASPRIFEVLKINAAPYDNARCINVAVGERTGKGLISLVEETNEGTGRVRELSREPADAGGGGSRAISFGWTT